MSKLAAAAVLAGAILLAGANAPAAQTAPPPTLIIDPESKCGTTNPFPTGGESIRWTGGCRDGLLDGAGTLTWYRNGALYERDEGTFRRGELHGEATISFADGSSVIGNYTEGRRNGEFMVIRDDGTYVQASYNNGVMVSERELSRRQVRNLLDERRRGAGATRTAAAELAAPRPAAPPPAAAEPAATGAPTPIVAAAPEAAVAAAAPVREVVPAGPPVGSTREMALAGAAPWSPSGAGGTAAAAAVPTAGPVTAAPAATLVGRMVCSARGLYEGQTRWCGLVRQHRDGELQVEIADVRLDGVFTLGIAGSECTGGEFIGRLSRGTRLWVPERCMR